MIPCAFLDINIVVFSMSLLLLYVPLSPSPEEIHPFHFLSGHYILPFSFTFSPLSSVFTFLKALIFFFPLIILFYFLILYPNPILEMVMFIFIVTTD